ncbi:TetR/AcrR family transcriptional regulator [Pseudohalocynthiibacter aestuariivivens]|nr:TetR/AcrR family transcriptional regulator [Pseudohalocynthiibacter aestuariivivens]QIE46007.1 TetR/AcrR family transcriptional regulator [Pseudohalocynthiibacter aestuariivivens]
MQTYSAAQVAEFRVKKQIDASFLTLAIMAAKSEVSGSWSGAEPMLLSSSSVTISPIDEGAIEASAQQISDQNSTQQVVRVTLFQMPAQDSEKRAVSEVLCVFNRAGDSHTLTVASAAGDQPATAGAPPSTTVETRRRQIFDGACKVIAKHGFGNATMREIAKEAGLSVPLMYKYIKDKDDILYLITNLSMQDIITHFDAEELLSGAPDQNLGKAIGRYVDYIDANRRYINLVYSETRSLNAENRMKVFDMERAFMKRWERILEQGVENRTFRPMNTELTANFIYFLCTVWALRHWSIGHFDAKEVKSALTDLVLTGLRANPK